jgi:hypothetical protein
MRVRSLLAGVAAVSAAVVAPAQAHEGNPNFRSEVTSVEPQVPGLEVEVINFDDSLLLRNETGETVVVEGYEGEPYVRIEPDGTVEINQDSPTFYLNQDRFAEAPVPESADATAPPDWRVANESGQYSWHDHRIHYMSQGTPAQVEDEGQRTKIFDYDVPLEVGSQRVEVLGTLFWVGQEEGFSAAPFIALGAVALIAGVAVLVVRRRRGGPRTGDDETKEAW